MMDQLSKERMEEIIAKDKDNLSQEEIGFLNARRSYLNDEQRVRFTEFLPEEGKKKGKK